MPNDEPLDHIKTGPVKKVRLTESAETHRIRTGVVVEAMPRDLLKGSQTPAPAVAPDAPLKHIQTGPISKKRKG